MKIMIVEDDFTIAESLVKELQKWNHEAVNVQDYYAITEKFHSLKPHLVLLDINLPHLNGFHWCQEIRQTSQVPIMFISSASDNMNQMMAMQMGADDFIEKPFNLKLTIMKIQALLRRSYDFKVEQSQLHVKGCDLIVDKAMLTYQDQTLSLTLTELQILQQLFINEDHYVSRNTLIEQCWQSENFIDDNTLAVNMSRLRKKLKQIGLVDFIQTKKNVGYKV
ncbi:response regulator transcription factor [Staphylococcus agnetis]|uniref:Response regulator transcription factor n=1 Tax=Staphylococcus agnetis TaxID=985762 RepID=A0ABD7TT52_9STAP|nr:response regulator transcription factor [Staphylococcus agnetis]UXU57391.1 response regulator transcription factor [Staphylococcus agnetis]UXU64359.1 response regulator transcription factor [Staphylococcus agnetis]UXU66699.1 response regulator transcription factor [Staphylococcus agnetis]